MRRGPLTTSPIAGWLGCCLLFALALPGSAAASLMGAEATLTYEFNSSILSTDTFFVGSGREIDCAIDSSPQLCSVNFGLFLAFFDVDADSMTFGTTATEASFSTAPFNGPILTVNDPAITITGASLASSDLTPSPVIDFDLTSVSINLSDRTGDASTGTVVTIQSVPEPSTAALLGVGLVLSAASRRKRSAHRG